MADLIHLSNNLADLTSRTSSKADLLWFGLGSVVFRDVTKFEFEFDNVRTSNVFNRFEIRRMF